MMPEQKNATHTTYCTIHATPTAKERASMTSSAAAEKPHLSTQNRPSHGHDTDGPNIANADRVAALIAQEVRDGYKAVTLIHSGQNADQDTLLTDCFSAPGDIAWIMRWGPIYHLGAERTGLNWKKASTDRDYTHADEHLISISRHRRNVPRENLHFETLHDLAAHARERNIHHAYIWEPDDAPGANGYWSYLRTMPHPPVQVPLDKTVNDALQALLDLLREEPTPDQTYDLDFIVMQPPPPGWRARVYSQNPCNGGLELAIDHTGAPRALVPHDPELPPNPSAPYGEVPLTPQERSYIRKLVNAEIDLIQQNQNT